MNLLPKPSLWVRLKAWCHLWTSPKHCYIQSSRWVPWLWAIALISFAVGTFGGLWIAPPDYQQGDYFRIIYVHVPTAIIAQSAYVMMALSVIVGLVWRLKLAYPVANALAVVGFVYTGLALVTGSIWGKPTWGTWWEWDGRMTSMLVLWFLYLGLVVVYRSFPRPELGYRVASVLTLVGVINLPIIKFSVDWWYSLHQPATFTLTEKPAMPFEMWWPLLVMLIGFYAFLGAVVLTRVQAVILNQSKDKAWPRQVLKLPKST